MKDEPDHGTSLSVTKAVERLLDAGGLGTLVTVIDGNTGIGKKLLLTDNGSQFGSLGPTALDQAVTSQARVFLNSREDTRVFRVHEFAPGLPEEADTLLLFERIQPEPRLVICGAGHVGAALARLGSLLGYTTTLIDDRAEFVRSENFPHQQLQLITANTWTDAVREAIGDGHGVAVAVVTRGHKEDEECMRAIVKTDPDYVGLIGSKRRTTIVLNRLREEGASEEQLKKIRAPIGLDIKAVTPEEVALAILAEIVAERRGGSGTSLSAWRRTS